MKNILCILLAICVVINSFSCKKINDVENKKEIVVFAASSLTETLTEIKDAFIKENENIEIIYNFASSGTLKKQIEENEYFDIFISASPKQINELEISEIPFIDKESRFDFLENKVVLVVPKENKKNINSFDDMVKGLQNKNILLSIGNSEAPIGTYAKKILSYYDLDEAKLANDGLINYGSNVKEVVTSIKEGMADCGIVYMTDAKVGNLDVVDFANTDMCGQVVYPIAISNNVKDKDLVKKYIDFLKQDASREIFEKVGFTVLG